jgi:3'-phosphoadenosine 5'-phosphosulfate sulfotransferase (PAPS reductase)/FAD synthetase
VKIVHVVSVSGGKDSAATLSLAINRVGVKNVQAIFCDTGNEHQAVYEYLDYLENHFSVVITRLKADFSEQIANKRRFIANDQRSSRKYKKVFKVDQQGNPVWIRAKDGSIRLFPVIDKETGLVTGKEPRQVIGWDSGKKTRWTNKAKRRALAVLVPTGNPYLDLCLWKGRFPSRKAPFCTEELKRNMAVGYQLDLIDAGYGVVSWQGVRRDESFARRNAKLFERLAPRMWVFRPLVNWTAAQVFDYCAQQGVKPNPLYLQGMGRVGCMPCVNVSKSELKEIASRFPDEIERIDQWEKLVAQASKRQAATFIPAPGIKNHEAKDNGIFSVVQWAKTTRGGRQFDLLADLSDANACSSAYGLCE